MSWGETPRDCNWADSLTSWLFNKQLNSAFDPISSRASLSLACKPALWCSGGAGSVLREIGPTISPLPQTTTASNHPAGFSASVTPLRSAAALEGWSVGPYLYSLFMMNLGFHVCAIIRLVQALSLPSHVPVEIAESCTNKDHFQSV